MLAAYLRRRFSTYSSCWVRAARVHIARKALASGLATPFF